MKFQEVALSQLHEGKDKIEESLNKRLRKVSEKVRKASYKMSQEEVHKRQNTDKHL